MDSGSGQVGAVYEILYNPNYMPRSSPKAHLENLTIDGKPSVILTKQSTEPEYYDVDPTTDAVWGLLDGKRTVKEIYEQVKTKNEEVTEKEVKDVIVSLAEEGMIESTEAPPRTGRVEFQSAFQLNVQLVKDASKSLVGFFKVTRKLIRGFELPLGLAITAVGFVLFFGSFLRIFNDPTLLNVAGSPLLGFFFYQIIVLLPVYAVHELAHAAVCDYYGARPGAIGTGLYYLSPFFYCDTSDGWRLSRRARIMISVAGPLSTVVISAFFVFLSYFVSGYARDVLQISAFFGFYGTLTNFSPVIETDGYYILADVLNMPNLRDEAFSFMKRAVLLLFRRPVKAVRRNLKERRIIAVYTVVTAAWLVFFGYTTAWLMGIYGLSAYQALSSIGLTILRTQPFDLTTISANVATLVYFGLIVAGFGVMGVVAYRNIRMKGIKLETIQDKRASLFLPLPSDTDRSHSSSLVERSRGLAKSYTRFSTVTLQPPFCVAELKLGKVDQSLEAMWDQMREIEESFRSLHRDFLGHANRGSAREGEKLRAVLRELAGQFSPSERSQADKSVAQFVKSQDDMVDYVLQSAFGTVWTLGLSPDDYKRLRRGMFPSLVAADLTVTDLPSRVEEFKVRKVVGLDAISNLSKEIEEESKEVYKRPEVFQTTVFTEPVKSRLVFIGRTDVVEGSVVWLGGLYLYQAWTSYIEEALEEASLGLKAIRLAHPASMTRTQASKLQDDEVEALMHDLEALATLEGTVNTALEKVESTFESATNFHEMLGNVVSDPSVDVGLYRPIMEANGAHLSGVRESIEGFRREFSWVARRLEASKVVVQEEHARRTSEATGRSLTARLSGRISSMFGNASRERSQAFDSEVKLSLASVRLVYGIVIGSDVIL